MIFSYHSDTGVVVCAAPPLRVNKCCVLFDFVHTHFISVLKILFLDFFKDIIRKMELVHLTYTCSPRRDPGLNCVFPVINSGLNHPVDNHVADLLH